jgi:hypothetical protein
MTNEITSSIPHGDNKILPDHEMFVQIFQLSCILENKIYVQVYKKLSEFNML